MIYKKLLFLLSFAAIIFINGCNKDEGPVNSSLPNESEVLIKYLEANGDYINSESFPALISAEEIWEGQLNKEKQIILDIRTICEYTNRGHIEGAVHINLSDIPAYYKEHQLENLDKVIITCLSGQSACYAASLLRLSGYKNVYAMIFGMSSWNPVFDNWTPFLSDNWAPQFERTAHEKNAAGSLPSLKTGKLTPEEILTARAGELMLTGFDNIGISCESVFLSLNDYYIINFASIESYLSGHVPKAVQYLTGQDFNLSTYLNTLPQDKTIVIYCASGHGTAQLAAFLKLVGYNVKSILFGNNGMNYSTVNGRKYTQEEVHNYPYVN